ncbi:MAG TPA: MBL fold metallo-hydrolase [Gemmatimonadaceae bacterium]|nr:MBL fold metallo-hydrolase [Gemmatimonadaceae bacterium]
MTPPSHHRPGGGFRNPWPGAAPHGFRDFLRWVLIDRRTRERPAPPDRSAFARATPSFAVPRARRDALTATRVGHSTVLMQLGALNVLTDPVWSERASPFTFAGPRRWVAPGVAFDALPPIDLVLISHSHYDHLDDRTVRRLIAAHPDAHWLAPLGVAAWLMRRGARQVTELDWWQEARMGDARIACLPAQHFSGRGLGDRNATLWCGWVVKALDWTMCFAGDTGLHPEFRAIGERYGPFDATLLPIGAYDPRWFMRPVHMDPEEAVQAFLELNGSTGRVERGHVMVPIHWGTFKLTDESMDEPPRRVRTAWERAGLDDDALWVLRVGETRAVSCEL